MKNNLWRKPAAASPSNSTPSLGTSICHRSGLKKQKKKKNLSYHKVTKHSQVKFQPWLFFLLLFFFFFFFFFLAFQGRTHGIWKFPGWGSNRSYSCQPQPLREARDQTYVLMDPSRILFFRCTRTGTPPGILKDYIFYS